MVKMNATAEMQSPRVLFLLLICAFSVACGGKYSVQSVQSKTLMQWPFQPAPAKVTYVESFHGFAKGSASQSMVRAVTGAKGRDNNLFLLPVSVAKGGDGRIAVADMGRKCVHLFIPTNNAYKRIAGQGKEVLQTPVNVIFDDELRLFVSDSSGKVFAFGNDSKLLFTISKAGDSALRRPTGLAYDAASHLLYVVDTLQDRVNAFDHQGNFAFSFGAKGDQQGQFNFPTHIFCSSSGKLYVTDSLNFRIQIFDTQGKFLGLFGNHGDSSGDLAMPKGIAADHDGVIYVVDSLFDNVQLFDSKGSFLLTVGQRGTDLGQFWLPSGAFLDQDMLYICDTYNHRVQVFRITANYSPPRV